MALADIGQFLPSDRIVSRLAVYCTGDDGWEFMSGCVHSYRLEKLEIDGRRERVERSRLRSSERIMLHR